MSREIMRLFRESRIIVLAVLFLFERCKDTPFFETAKYNSRFLRDIPYKT